MQAPIIGKALAGVQPLERSNYGRLEKLCQTAVLEFEQQFFHRVVGSFRDIFSKPIAVSVFGRKRIVPDFPMEITLKHDQSCSAIPRQ